MAPRARDAYPRSIQPILLGSRLRIDVAGRSLKTK
jgi:hypothetical protein